MQEKHIDLEHAPLTHSFALNCVEFITSKF